MPAQVALPDIPEAGPAIDTAHTADGYVVARMSSAARLKFQVACNDAVYNYDLPNNGSPTVFPINMGDGAYRFRIMKNIDGNDYAEAESVDADVALTSEFAPFLMPNQYCWYDAGSACTAKARELADGAATQAEAVKRVCDFIVGNVTYDIDKATALSSQTGYVPNPDATLASGTGVCFDYASLGAAMLRSLGIPAKVVTGYVSPDGLYHAWVMAYVDGTWSEGSLGVQPNEWSRLDLTFAAANGAAPAGDGITYTDRYVY
ncbi:MAG: transglutaminase domain-containing protein [Eggerthellaceae bacterium]|nr:transglutaminase domain-containing protein [Eggerthellaceae bacterium]